MTDIGAVFDAWAAAYPEEAAYRLAWAERCDGAELSAIRARCASGEAAANLEALYAQRRRAEAARAAEQLRAIESVRDGRDPADVLSRASLYLAHAEGGTSGSGRNPQAWSVVLRVTRGFALSEGQAFDLLASEYAPRCKPALPRIELAGMVRRAIRGTRPPWGYLLERKSA